MRGSRSIALDGVATLGKIIDGRREIQVWCDKCQVYRRFTQDEMVALAEKVGRDYSLVDRRCRCRLTPGCDGWNRFDFLQGVYRPMTTPDGNAYWMKRDWDERRS